MAIGDRYQQWYQRSFERGVPRQLHFQRTVDRRLLRRAARRWWWATGASLAGFAFLLILKIIPADSSVGRLLTPLAYTSFAIGLVMGIWGELCLLKARRH